MLPISHTQKCAVTAIQRVLSKSAKLETAECPRPEYLLSAAGTSTLARVRSSSDSVVKLFVALATRSYRIREAGISDSIIARFGSSLNQHCASGVSKIVLHRIALCTDHFVANPIPAS